MYQDNILELSFANDLQQEIIDIPLSKFDRYDNCFEQKYTLRNKDEYPKYLQILINYLTNKDFVEKLSELTGYNLLLDTFKHYYGVHKYINGDSLDIHLDAGYHPLNGLKKQITLGIYLSKNWQPNYGCQLEIWNGNNEEIFECVNSIEPKFNRLIIFTNNDVSWHGNPNVATCPNDAQRIFITISYLSENNVSKNKKMRAFFVKRPNDPHDAAKDDLRLLRADNVQCKKIYNLKKH